jgi:ABC-type transport system involved in cytochrome c biogenesis permease subunit
MKRWFPWLITGIFTAWVISALIPRPESGLHLRELGRLPVLLNGRVQPLDSVARNTLLQLRGKSTAPIKLHFSVFDPKLRGQTMPAMAWMLELMVKPDLADTRKVFRIDHPELVALLKLPDPDPEKGEDGKHFSWNDLEPRFDEIQKQSRQAGSVEGPARTAFQRGVMKLFSGLSLYHRVKFSLQPAGTEDYAREIADFEKSVPAGVEAVRNREAGKDYNKEAFDHFMHRLEGIDTVARNAYPMIIPPEHPTESREQWMNMGASLMSLLHGGGLHPVARSYVTLATAYKQDRVEDFNQALAQLTTWMQKDFEPELNKGRNEYLFNHFQPFYLAMTIYVMAFLLACASWFNWSDWLRRAAFQLVVLGFVVHTSGLLYRMILEGRPPVTNLYSSAVFIGWGAVILGMVLERIYRDGIGSVVGAFTGFVTLVIAHNLAVGGDTMEMMRAVLDTNFWLATHVVTITLGYSSTFVAGFLAVVFIVRGLFTTGLSETTAKALSRMVYGIICFATLFSFAGTVLGGIWADQSWGRFWGWDPKENGALIIVLWNAVILHARWGGLVRERGLMNLTIFGNIVTSFSWFGVNMLGIGLHSYGFMDSAFKWLMLFIGSQLLFIALGMIPLRFWASFKGGGPGANGKLAGGIKPASA